MDTLISTIIDIFRSSLPRGNEIVVKSIANPDNPNIIVEVTCGCKNNKLEGTCTIDYELTSESYYHITCEFKDSLLDGIFVKTRNNRDEVICNYTRGYLNGKYILFDNGGNIMERHTYIMGRPIKES